MAQRTLENPKELELLKQLIGEWAVGIAMKTSNGKIISGCGEMSAAEVEGPGINSEINMHIEGYEDYNEIDLWSFDQTTGKVHLYSITSEGEAHDHVGKWKDDMTLELNWKGTYEGQDMEEQITVKWVTKNQIELKEINYSKGKALMTTNYIFRRKQT